MVNEIILSLLQNKCKKCSHIILHTSSYIYDFNSSLSTSIHII